MLGGQKHFFSNFQKHPFLALQSLSYCLAALLKGAELSFLYNKLSVDLVPVEHILIDNNPETALVI